MAAKRKLDPIHPGEILYEDFMKPLGVSMNALAREIAVPPNRISDIVNGKRSITADTALRLGKYFGVSPETKGSRNKGVTRNKAKQRGQA